MNIKNCDQLLMIEESVSCWKYAKQFSELDLINIYHY